MRKQLIIGLVLLGVTLAIIGCDSKNDSESTDNAEHVQEVQLPDTPDAPDTSDALAPSEVIETTSQHSFVDGVDLIVLYWSGRWPPKSEEDDADDPEHWFTETVLFPDGRVERTESSYYGIIMKTEAWQVDSDNFAAMVTILSDKGFIEIPEAFRYGAHDESAYTLIIHTDDIIHARGYQPATEEYPADEQSYAILMECIAAFLARTAV
jgi:hypothetical protein